MIGLCICYYNHNYGSMLQAYATVKEMEKRKLSFDIIHYEKQKDLNFIIRNMGRVLNGAWRSEKKLLLQKKISSYCHPEYRENAKTRSKYFMNFQHKYFDKFVTTYKGYDALRIGAKKYDIVLSGSDQMWSPSGLATNFYNLMFVPDDICKVSYASSFGVSQIPFYQRQRTSLFLSRLDYVSLRESRGVEIVKELTGRNAELVVDPTMLLSSEEWDEFSGKESFVKGDYIFAYFLGNNKKHRLDVEILKEKTGLKVVSLRHLDEYVKGDDKFGDYAPYNIGPEEFINLIKYAKYVCTDSFHGTVFSILFHKKFLTFSRFADNSKTSRNSRIVSLLANLGIENRHYVDGEIFNSINASIDYDSVEKYRMDMIQYSKQYLDNALKSEGDFYDESM